MGERDITGTDDLEPWRGRASEHMYFITRAEFQNLHNDVRDTIKSLAALCGDMKVIKQHIEEQKEAENRRLKKWGIVVGIISIITSFFTSRVLNP